MIVNKVPRQRFLASTHCPTNFPNFPKCCISAGHQYSLFVSREGITWWAVSAFSSYLFSISQVSVSCRGTGIHFLTITLRWNKVPTTEKSKIKDCSTSCINVSYLKKACLILTWYASDNKFWHSLQKPWAPAVASVLFRKSCLLISD